MDYHSDSKYYEPTACIADIEVMMNVSHRTAERLMRRMKRELGIGKWRRPTKKQVESYFGKVKHKIVMT